MHIDHGLQQSSQGTNGHSSNGELANGSLRAKNEIDKRSERLAVTNSLANNTNGNGIMQTYQGHDKQEVVRLVMQSLKEMGYGNAAATLEAESGIEMESPSIAAFRYAVLNGEWEDAEMLLFGDLEPSNSNPNPNSRLSGNNLHDEVEDEVVDDGDGHARPRGLPLRQGADRDDLRQELRRQKYLELLEQRDHGRALMVLRQEITPLNLPKNKLHHLSSLMVCSTAENLRKEAWWAGVSGGTRQTLLENLSYWIHHSVIVPPSRLASLLSQTKKAWIGNCVWHNPIEPISLFIDHTCDKDQFPLYETRVLHHSDEIYHVSFSHNGRWLAASGKDKAAIIYEVGGDWEERFRFGDHQEDVGFGAWSPDDSLFVTCSRDKLAKLWSMSTGSCVATLSHFTEAVTAVAWLPDGSGFVTGTLEAKDPLRLWTLDAVMGKSSRPTGTFPAADFRVQDVAITPDGESLLAISATTSNGHLSIFDLQSPGYDERFRIKFDSSITCISISKDSRYVLMNTTDCKIQCFDLEEMEVIQTYTGQRQGTYVIRSCLGGADENLVISGSEDGKIYVFHRERGSLIETFSGHKSPGCSDSSCVNAVAWNPVDMCMFASCGDDGTIRIWSKDSAYTSKDNAFTPATTRRTSSSTSVHGTGSRRASAAYTSSR